jgi:glycosyltransferase involved in cell wall biosynthesis
MRILFLTQVLPYPLVGGAKIRAYYVLRYLAQDHDITLVSFAREDDRLEDVDHLKDLCSAVHTVPISRSVPKDAIALLSGLVTRRPAVILRDRNPDMLRLLERMVSDHQFDAIHADQTSMAQYAMQACMASGNGHSPLTVLDEHNALHLVVSRQAAFERGWRKTLWKLEARQMAKYEARICRDFDRVLTVSNNDMEALLSLYSPSEAAALAERFTVLPICIEPLSVNQISPLTQEHRILHIGTMFWPPNEEGIAWFANEIMPKVLAQLPASHLTIVGKNPPKRVRQLAEPGSPLYGLVEVTGYLADVSEQISRSRVFVVPLMAGGGMRVKILDAWRWGLPVVSTTLGAEGIAVRDGEDILLADNTEDFAQSVARVLTEPGLAQRLRRGGRLSVETHYDWRREYEHLDSIYAP